MAGFEPADLLTPDEAPFHWATSRSACSRHRRRRTPGRRRARASRERGGPCPPSAGGAAPAGGIEPPTPRLTSGRSTIELHRNMEAQRASIYIAHPGCHRTSDPSEEGSTRARRRSLRSHGALAGISRRAVRRVDPRGIEPPAVRLRSGCSIHLSYGSARRAHLRIACTPAARHPLKSSNLRVERRGRPTTARAPPCPEPAYTKPDRAPASAHHGPRTSFVIDSTASSAFSTAPPFHGRNSPAARDDLARAASKTIPLFNEPTARPPQRCLKPTGGHGPQRACSPRRTHSSRAPKRRRPPGFPEAAFANVVDRRVLSCL